MYSIYNIHILYAFCVFEHYSSVSADCSAVLGICL